MTSDQVTIKVNLRPAKRSDLGSIYTIDLQSYPWSLSEGAWIQILKSQSSKSQVLVAGRVKSKGVLVVGYLWFLRGPGGFQVQRLAVRKGYRGHGVGQGLVGSLAGSCSMVCSESNLQGLAALRSWGFKSRVPLLKDFYGDQGDGIVMVREGSNG